MIGMVWFTENALLPDLISIKLRRACLPRQPRFAHPPDRRAPISNGQCAALHPLFNGVPPYGQRTEKRCPQRFQIGPGLGDREATFLP